MVSLNVKLVVDDGYSIDIREDKWLSTSLIGGLANQGDPQLVADLIMKQRIGMNKN